MYAASTILTWFEEELQMRQLVTVYAREAKEPWYLVTNLAGEPPAEIVRLYKRRMWIEAAFRDLKNSNWGLGMDQVRLTKASRLDRPSSSAPIAPNEIIVR